MNFLARLLGRKREAAKSRSNAAKEADRLASGGIHLSPASPVPQPKPVPDEFMGGIAPAPAVAPEPPPPPETDAERILRETVAYVSGEADHPPEADHAHPLHDALIANLTRLRSCVDWRSNTLTSSRGRIASEASEDALADTAGVDGWSALMSATSTVLRRIAPRRKIAVVVCMRDDGVSIIDWIAHHRATGFEAIFVYTNDNADGSQSLLEALADQGVVHLIDNHTGDGVNPQRKAFAHSLWLLPELRDYEWVFYADSDEFLVLSARYDHRVDRLIADAMVAEPDVSAICCHWRWFVSDHAFAWHDAPLTLRQTYAIPHASFKSIVRLAQATTMIRLHFPEVSGSPKFLDPGLSPIPMARPEDVDSLWEHKTAVYEDGWINHYWCKTFEEFLIKKNRGDALRPSETSDFRRDLDLFFTWNRAHADAKPAPLPPALIERAAAERASLMARPTIEALHHASILGFRAILHAMGGPAAILRLYGETAGRLDARRQFAGLVAPDHTGPNYLALMTKLHDARAPEAYLEIGPPEAGTLALARCQSLVVDPYCALTGPVIGDKPACHFFRTSSDGFFARHDPQSILGTPIDLAFLDGLHLFEALLRDFINTERHATRASMIVLHDCLPIDVHMARRDFHDMSYEAIQTHADWWTGDVWKVPLILRKHRPDLRIVCLDCAPTGAVLITDLDPKSTKLDDEFDAIVAEFAGIALPDMGLQALFDRLDVTPAEVFLGAGDGRAGLTAALGDRTPAETASQETGRADETGGEETERHAATPSDTALAHAAPTHGAPAPDELACAAPPTGTPLEPAMAAMGSER